MLWSVLSRFARPLIKCTPFRGSAQYWQRRYRWGGDSGRGSRGPMAQRKAEVINGFVRENGIRTIIEFGCGDGQQLALADYPAYVGFDVSPEAVRMCRRKFRGDESKQFRLVSEYDGESADLALSLDVILHLVEDETFNVYMRRLFSASGRYVLIFSTDFHADGEQPHVRHRVFTTWVEEHMPAFRLVDRIASNTDSPAEFFIYRRVGA